MCSKGGQAVRLEEENPKLKPLVADLRLDDVVLKDLKKLLEAGSKRAVSAS